MYMWSDEWVGEDGVAEEMAECVGVPASAYIDCSVDVGKVFHLRWVADWGVCFAESFDARDLKWAPDGKGMILLDRDAFCCAFEVEDGLPEEDY